MEFETVALAAKRLSVTPRAVQKWAKDGKISGAFKSGRDWLIPKTFTPFSDFNTISYNNQIQPLPLLNGCFPIGKALEYIDSLEDEDEKNIALSEYYYYTGDAETATRYAEPYLDSGNPILRISAALMCVFSNLVSEHAHLTDFAVHIISEELEKAEKNPLDDELYALLVLSAATVEVQFQVKTRKAPPLENYVKYLKGGLKLFACYVLAFRVYLRGDYHRCLAIADTALLLSEKTYPLSFSYLNIISAIALINLKESKYANKRMEEAFKSARPDNLIMTFVEHYSLFGGMTEVYFKKNHPKDYEAIISATKHFNNSWYKIHNNDTEDLVADNLTTTEFTIAMLYNRNWRIKEIAEHMDLSERTIKNYLQIIYEKLCINGKKGLSQYMMK